MALKDTEKLARATATLEGAVEASGGRRGGVRVKLVGLKTFEGRGRRGERGRGGTRGGRGGRGASVTVSAEYEEREEGTADRPNWETSPKQQLQEYMNKASKSDYENCRVLWVEPRDASPTFPATTIGLTPEHGLDMVLSRGEGTSNLLTLANSLRDYFASQGLLQLSPKDKDKPLTLHMTVLNAVYAQERKQGGDGGGGGDRVKGGRGGKGGYDVRGLVEEFNGVVWAEDVLFDRLEIMRMREVKGEEGSVREGESWYESIDSVLL